MVVDYILHAGIANAAATNVALHDTFHRGDTNIEWCVSRCALSEHDKSH